MKLRFLDPPKSADNLTPSPDCFACNNGCCGSNGRPENNASIDALLDSIINPHNFSH